MLSLISGLFAKLATGVNTTAIWALLQLALVGGAYWFGYDHAKTNNENATLKAEQARYTELLSRYWQEKEKITTLQDQLEAAKNNVRIVKEQVKVYVSPEKDRDCGPDAATVGLLNATRDAAVSTTASVPITESETPPEISYTAQLQDTIEITGQYNELMLRHNALIEWIETTYGNAKPK